MTTATLTAPIHQQLRDLRQAHRLRQREVADLINVAENSIRNWELGQKRPHLHQVIAYAEAFNHQLTITLNGAPVCDVRDMLPNLAELRHRHGLALTGMGAAINVGPTAVGVFERRAAKGVPVLLATLERYLDALGYQINVTPKQATRPPHESSSPMNHSVQPDPVWQNQAACRSYDPAIWFPAWYQDNQPQVKKARRICRACPVLADCRRFVDEQPQSDGIWAAMTPSERRRRRLSQQAGKAAA